MHIYQINDIILQPSYFVINNKYQPNSKFAFIIWTKKLRIELSIYNLINIIVFLIKAYITCILSFFYGKT